MNKNDFVNIRFYFPTDVKKVKDRKSLAHLFLSELKRDGGIKYAGYLKEKDLRNELSSRIGDGDLSKYELLDRRSRERISKAVIQAAKKCQKLIPLPNLPIFVFVFPWLLDKRSDSVMFGGVNAFVPYLRTVHVFIDSNSYTEDSIKETIAHEWNHLYFYNNHPSGKYTLLERMIMEGLAECFREENFGGKPSPWSTALTKKEAESVFRRVKPLLKSKSFKLFEEVVYGGGKFKKWTGYSIGYRLVKSFRSRHGNLCWVELMKTGNWEALRLWTNKGHNS